MDLKQAQSRSKHVCNKNQVKKCYILKSNILSENFNSKIPAVKT